MNIRSKIKSVLWKTTSSMYIASMVPPFMRGAYLRVWYRLRMGRMPDLKHPVLFTEKIQWMKLHPDPLWSMLADKYAVRRYVEERIGAQYLVPLVGNNGGVWESPDAIDFDSLPQKFVLKCNHGSGYNIIVRDKSMLDIPATRLQLTKWLKEDFCYYNCMEMHYKAIPKRIIAEEYMENEGGDLYDYKVWCFGGKAAYIQLISDRFMGGMRKAFYDREWNMQEFCNGIKQEHPHPKPANLGELLELAETLSKGLPYARVDFYILEGGAIRFGEVTLTPAAGVFHWNDPSTDRKLGDMLVLPAK